MPKVPLPWQDQVADDDEAGSKEGYDASYELRDRYEPRKARDGGRHLADLKVLGQLYFPVTKPLAWSLIDQWYSELGRFIDERALSAS